MNRVSATIRLTLGLLSLAISVLFGAYMLGFVPDPYGAEVRGRNALCESIAVSCSVMAARDETGQMEGVLAAMRRRNPDILSAGIRLADGQLLFEVGDHALYWPGSDNDSSSDSAMTAPISAHGQFWGNAEVRFQPLVRRGVGRVWHHPVTMLAGFVSLVSLPMYFWYLRKMLEHFDPSQVIPDRVRAAFDALTGGLVVVDRDERILLANKAFANNVGLSPEQLKGLRASQLPWVKKGEGGGSNEPFPWTKSIAECSTQTGVMLGLASAETSPKTFIVNSAPLLGDDGKCRGALTSFDDVTQLENSRAELTSMLELLKNSREEIHRQNEELKILATKDPLTACLNRRSFLGHFEMQWSMAQRHKHSLSCMMVDVDHFKSINDNHGHAVGDQVLQKIASLLNSCVRAGDLVCRYGGEEFAVLLPHLDLAGAKRAAERFRQAIESRPIHGLSVTASFGIASMDLGAKDPHELLNEADRSLYVAKRNGRNQVVAWPDVPSDLEIDESKISRTRPPTESDGEIAIPFHAVTALISALAYRDQATAEHSRRVADLCVATANGLMSVRKAYVLEIAALLHDIGKIGVPDSILLKPGQLSEEEWRMMQVHDRIGVEIIRSTFGCLEIAEIVQTHHAWYGGNADEPGSPTGSDIPLSARILTIADAFDAMVSNRVFRKGRTQEAAFSELRRFAGKQFDPDLVKRFIQTVEARDENRVIKTPAVSKQTALKIGLEIERLACTLDSQDIAGLAALAGRLKATASKSGIAEIAELAEQLQQKATDDPHLATLVELTQNLLELCRSTQRAYLNSTASHSISGPPTPDLSLSICTPGQPGVV